MAKKRKKKQSRRTQVARTAAPRVTAQGSGQKATAQATPAPVSTQAVLGRGSLWDSMLVGLLILVIATPAIVGPYGQKSGYTPDLHMAAYIQVGAMIILTLFLLSTFIRKQITLPRSPVLLPLLLFYGWAMLSILWADTKYEAVVDALDWSGAFLCALLIMLLLRHIAALNALLFFLFVSGLLMALLGIGQWLFGIDWVQQHIVPAATFSNKNMAGQYGVLTLPLAIMFFARSKSNFHIWFFAVSIALIAVYIFYTRSRGALIGFTTEMIVLSALLIYLRRKHGYHFFHDFPIKKIALGVAFVLFLGMSYLTPAMFDNENKVVAASIGSTPEVLRSETGIDVLKNTSNFSGSAETRTTMWANSIPMFKDNFLIGVGLGNWTIHYARYQSWFKQDKSLMENKYHANAHNDYIEILCELGIIGFGIFIWVVVSLLRMLSRLLSHPREEYFLVTAMLTLAIMGLAVNALFSFPLKQPVPIFIIMVYIGVLSNLYAAVMGSERDHTLTLPALPFRGLAVVIATLMTASLITLHYNWYQTELYYRAAVIALQNKAYSQAYAASKRAYELNPLRKSLLWLKATALMQIDWRSNTDDIASMFNQVVEARPYSVSTLFNLEQLYRRANRFDEAAEVMKRLISVQPSNAWGTYRYGINLMRSKQLEQGIAAIKTARALFVAKNYNGYHNQTIAKIDGILAGTLKPY